MVFQDISALISLLVGIAVLRSGVRLLKLCRKMEGGSSPCSISTKRLAYGSIALGFVNFGFVVNRIIERLS